MSGSAITESRSYTAETCRSGDLSFTRHLRSHNPTYDKECKLLLCPYEGFRIFLVPMLCVGMHTGRLCLLFCESQSPYDSHTCMYPKIEAEPLRAHSQAEHGNERFSCPGLCPWSYGTGRIHMVFKILTFLFFYPVNPAESGINPVRILRSG